MSRNAREIFRVFIDHPDVRVLTTLDLQQKLKPRHIRLKKKEINAWLNNLQEAGLISKGRARGKPTTIDYSGKYTYDLWGLNQRGRDLVRKLANFLSPKTSLEGGENVGETRGADISSGKMGLSHDPDYLKLSILRAVSENQGAITLESIRDKLAPPQSLLEEEVFMSEEQGYLKVVETRSGSLKTKILGLLGIPYNDEKRYEITELGRTVAERLQGDPTPA
ncbi:MAG: hypothetical protein PVJ38_04245 [Candidatus Bathyarchaeota archaeon]